MTRSALKGNRASRAAAGLASAVAAWASLPALGAHADTLASSPARAATTSWFNWVDHASPGMWNDNIHLLNPGGAAAGGTITVPGVWSAPFTVPAGGQSYVSVPPGVIGGPAIVQVTSGPGVIASQRVQFYASFTEVPAALASDALAEGWFPWYDHASPGMWNDNIHVLNPGPGPAAGTFYLPGSSPLPFSLAGGAEAWYSFPQGTISGPLHFAVTSGPPVVVSQRVQYQQSFSEVLALDPARAATTLYFDWFDQASPGVLVDNVHVLNPGPNAVTGTIGVPGLGALSFSIPAGGQRYLAWPGRLGGPVRIDASGPILATQRLSWPPTFVEWPARAPADVATDAWFPWYDDAGPSMVDDVHVTNPGGAPAQVSLTLPGAPPISLTVGPGEDRWYTFPRGTIGGPLRVQVQSGPAVLVAQRAFSRPPPPTSRTLDVPFFHQRYPLSCEEAALRMALAYQGIGVTEEQILSTMGIDYRSAYYDAQGGFHWGDPYASFVGDPSGSEIDNTGYGSYNEAIARTASRLGGRIVASGEQITPDYIYQSILDGHPVIAWVPFDWNPHRVSFYSAFDGRSVRFGSPWEHAVALVGVTPDSLLVNNPWSGVQWISRSQFENAFWMFNRMAVVLQ